MKKTELTEITHAMCPNTVPVGQKWVKVSGNLFEGWVSAPADYSFELLPFRDEDLEHNTEVFELEFEDVKEANALAAAYRLLAVS